MDVKEGVKVGGGDRSCFTANRGGNRISSIVNR